MSLARRVLVLGGHGFIGKALVKGLKQEGFSVDAPTHSEVDVRHMTGVDVTEYAYCYNLASTTHNYHILSDPYFDIDVNCNGAVSVLEEFQKHNRHCKHIYISTFFVNDGHPLALYGTTKLCAEHIYQTYSRVYGLDTVILRLPNVYGPGEKGDQKKGSLNWMIENTVQGRIPLVYYAGDALREFLYIDDAVSEIIQSPRYIMSGSVLNIPGCRMRMRDFIRIIDPTAKEVAPPDFHLRVGLWDYKSHWSFRGKVSPVAGIQFTKEYYANALYAV